MVPGQLSLSLNVSKTKELIVDFRKRQQRPYTPLMISGTPVERVSSFKYHGVNISEDLACQVSEGMDEARTQLQEVKGLFIHKKTKQTNKNYPVGEKQTGWLDKAGQGKAGQDTDDL